MKPPDDRSIRFTCPRCMSWLKASPSMANARHRCPRCQMVCLVPRESPPVAKGESYAIRKLDSAAEPLPIYASVACHACQSRLYGTLDEVGKPLVCLDCGASTVLPPPETRPTIAQPDPGGYSLRDETLPASSELKVDPEPLIRVYCHVCDTMMYAREAEIGRKLTCPDCGSETPVVRPEPKPSPEATSEEEIGEYALASEFDPTGGRSPEAQQEHIALTCHVCGTRLHATLDQIGQAIVCPDCGVSTDVPAATVRNGAGQGGAAETAASNWIEPPPLRPDIEPGRDRRDPKMLAERERRRIEHGRAIERAIRKFPPGWLYFSGTFSFPFLLTSLTQTLVLLGELIVPLLIMQAGFAVAEGALYGPVVRFTAVLMAGPCLMVYFVTQLVYAVVILRDTSYGRRTVEDWPTPFSIDSIGESLWLFAALVWSLMPVGITAWLWQGHQGLTESISVCCIVFLFPVVLLSILEANSVLVPVSIPVLRSIVRSWKAWLLFYIVALGMAAAYVVAVALAIAFRSDAVTFLAWMLLPVVWMIYFRLLGRLAWFCAGGTVDAAPSDSPKT